MKGLIILLFMSSIITGCSYVQPFGPKEEVQLPPRRTDVDEVIDSKVEAKDGQGLSHQGFQWGGP